MFAQAPLYLLVLIAKTLIPLFLLDMIYRPLVVVSVITTELSRRFPL